jgi:hypothetical protein
MWGRWPVFGFATNCAGWGSFCRGLRAKRGYPGIGAAVTERLFLNARSMRGFLNTPDGAVYGFAPLPPKRVFGLAFRDPRGPRCPASISPLHLQVPADLPER